MLQVQCDILVVGGGMGGTAAALRACALGRRVIVTEPTRWLGGQATSQGVSALDEHQYIEGFGGTEAYNEFRRRIRAHYRQNYQLVRDHEHLNPGGGWVSGLCFEPRVAVQVLQEMLAPVLADGLLTVFYRTEPTAVERRGSRIQAVIVRNLDTGEQTRIEAAVMIDASELGDLLPLAGVPYRTGMESFAETHEPSAPAEGDPEAVQSFTYPFAVEYRPGENHVIARPKGYERFRDRQPYSLEGYKMFAGGGPIGLPFWTYRRLIDASLFIGGEFPHDIAMINWPANDYHGGNIIDAPPELLSMRLDEAKRLALGFLYWLQTEAPRDDGGCGYPELKLRPDIMGTADGLAQHPYIRESRRLKAYHTIREQEIVAAYNPGSRAQLHHDSVGLGFYVYVDIHKCCNTDLRPGSHQALRPFQIPLGALISPEVDNLVAGGKNIGTTHITNGAYRLHPMEWNIGESAGALAAFALDHGVSPGRVYHGKRLLRSYQEELARNGIPLYWFEDVPNRHPAFVAVQTLAVQGVISGEPADLLFHPQRPIGTETAQAWSTRAGVDVGDGSGLTRAEYAVRLARAVAERVSAV